MRNLRPSTTLVAVALLALTGCFKLSRESPRLQQYVLGGVQQPVNASTAQTASTPSGITLGLRRLDLAAYLAVPAIIIRGGENELITSEFHRWGETLDEGINRVVAANLALLPSVAAVYVAPWRARAQHNYLVQLHVWRFEGVTNGGAGAGRIHVRADWDIIRPLDGKVLVRGNTDDREGTWRVGDYASLVTVLDRALVRLAGDIGDCIARFPNDSTPPVGCASTRGMSGRAP